MAKSKHTDNTTLVTEFIKTVDPEIAPLMEAVRQTILAADKQIAEQVKWNAPAFYYTGDMPPFDPKEYKRDMVVFNFHKKKHLLLVLPSGAKVSDPTKLLEGSYKDGRRLLTIKDMDDLAAKKDALQDILREWISMVDK